jgi:hypothetical protein
MKLTAMSETPVHSPLGKQRPVVGLRPIRMRTVSPASMSLPLTVRLYGYDWW